ncbi:hypothetical protein HDV00_010755 [Rhizophlyctis rosea]|nr:hypothetical protein HDV00_010755 [Rhizophlyctis rosea]
MSVKNEDVEYLGDDDYNDPDSPMEIKDEKGGTDSPMNVDGDALGDGEDLTIEGWEKNSAWLVKVPGFLADYWEEQARNGVDDLGTLRLYARDERTGKQPMTVDITELASKNTPSVPIPYQYNLNTTLNHPKRTYSFTTEPTKGLATSLHATISTELSLLPDRNSEAYRRLLKARSETSAQPRRRTGFITTSEGKATTFIAPASNSRVNANKGFTFNKNDPARLAAEREMKRERLPKVELQNLIFKQFELYPYINFKGLQEKILQPQQYLKEVLNEVAMQVKKGPYANMWTIRPEYKAATGASDAGGGAGASGSGSGSGGGEASGNGNGGNGDQDGNGDDDDDDLMEE